MKPYLAIIIASLLAISVSAEQFIKIEYIYAHPEQDLRTDPDFAFLLNMYWIKGETISRIQPNDTTFLILKPIIKTIRSNLDYYASFEGNYDGTILIDSATGYIKSCQTSIADCSPKTYCSSVTEEFSNMKPLNLSKLNISSINISVQFSDTLKIGQKETSPSYRLYIIGSAIAGLLVMGILAISIGMH
jgi:hypothetical protein